MILNLRMAYGKRCVVPIAAGDLTSLGNTEIRAVLDVTLLLEVWRLEE